MVYTSFNPSPLGVKLNLLSSSNVFVRASVNLIPSCSNTVLMGAPWTTIQKAASTAQAGNAVNVHAGTYIEKVTFNNSSTEIAAITFIGMGTVIVEGTASTSVWSAIFNLNAKRYIRIQHFQIQNSHWFGIYVEGYDHIYLKNNNTYNTGASGSNLRHSSDVYASYNIIRKACYQSLSMGSQECITFSGVYNTCLFRKYVSGI